MATPKTNRIMEMTRLMSERKVRDWEMTTAPLKQDKMIRLQSIKIEIKKTPMMPPKMAAMVSYPARVKAAVCWRTYRQRSFQYDR